MENPKTVGRVTHTHTHTHTHTGNLEDEDKKKIKRNSSIELLKIIAIILVVLSHSMPDRDTNTCTYISAIDINLGTNFQMFVIQIMHNLGQIANCIFLICSAWFLVDSKKTKGEKIATFFGDVFFQCVFTVVVAYIAGYRFSATYTIKQLIPIIFGNSWFISHRS